MSPFMYNVQIPRHDGVEISDELGLHWRDRQMRSVTQSTIEFDSASELSSLVCYLPERHCVVRLRPRSPVPGASNIPPAGSNRVMRGIASTECGGFRTRGVTLKGTSVLASSLCHGLGLGGLDDEWAGWTYHLNFSFPGTRSCWSKSII